MSAPRQRPRRTRLPERRARRAGLAGILAAALVAPAAAHVPQATPAEATAAEATRDELLADFIEDLQRLRDGESEAAATLLSTAERLKSDHARPDTVAIANFYAGLGAAERARGLERYDTFLELRGRVVRARREGRTGVEWATLRMEVLADLERLASEYVPGEDPAPIAHALGLRAQLGVEWAERNERNGDAEWVGLAERARKDATASCERFEEAGMLKPRLDPLWTLARAEHLLGNRKNARAIFRSCLATAEQLDHPGYRERALMGLIRMAREEGSAATQDRLLDELARVHTPGGSWPLLRAHVMRLLDEDQPEAALAALAGARPSSPEDALDWELLAGSAAVRARQVDVAEGHFSRLAEGEGRAAEATLARATLELERGERAVVIGTIESLLDSEELSDLRRAQARTLLGRALLESGRSAEAIGWLSEAIDEADAWRRRLGPDAEQNVIGEWIGLHTVVLLARSLAEEARHLEAARVVEEFQSRSLREGAAAKHEDDAQLTREDLLAWAARTELGLVTWVVGPDQSLVVHVAPDGDALALPIERGRQEIRRATRRLREAALEGSDAAVERLGAELTSELLPAPLRERLVTSGAAPGRRLLFLLHGPLESLPVELLRIRGRWLDDVLTACVLPGLPDARPGEGVEALVGWTLIGDVAGTDELPALPGAAAELEAVAALHPDAAVHAGGNCTLEAVEAALRSGGALHAATHLTRACGHESERLAPLGLALADGEVLCAHRVAELAPALPLAVLSACETGGGSYADAEGLLGLSRSFLEAGTRNLLVTHWPVEDLAAREHALAFHRALADGALPSEAARRARTALREEGWVAADWAAFRLLGRD